MDRVVEEIDRLAYERNTNRSNLINQILAESLGLITPEMKMRDIFTQLESIFSEASYQLTPRSSDFMLAVRSSIKYKYRPVIKYSIELFREPKDIVGRLKVSFRTSSSSFISAVENFFRNWIQVENAYLGDIYLDGVPADFENSKYTRGFLEISEENDLSEEEIANAIGAYIKMLDKCIKFYFENLEEEEAVKKQINTIYKTYLTSGLNII